MRTRLAVLAAILLCSVAAPAPASAGTVRGVTHRVEARVEAAAREWKQLPKAEQGAMVRAAAREWKQLPKAEQGAMVRAAAQLPKAEQVAINRVVANVKGAIFAAQVRAAAREWKQLPQAELACADQALREHGQSVEELARRGASPSNPRLATLRKQCSAAAAALDAGQIPTQGAGDAVDRDMPLSQRGFQRPD